jgi:triphosphoribosyl-dephospho-CoA synthase
MTATDFLRSAAVSAPLLAQSRKSVGECILEATQATIAVANCNTNLGIVLLATPLAHAAMLQENDDGLRDRLSCVLNRLSLEDSVFVFAAIRHASPGGLGSSDAQDVNAEPSLALKDVMQIAAVRDRIAFQYANDFEDIFSLGVPLLRHYRARWGSISWAAVGVYLAFLARYLDSHVVRKHDATKANEVLSTAQALESNFKACENPATLMGELSEFDRQLKQEGVNPGTSADLTVASVLALLLLHL